MVHMWIPNTKVSKNRLLLHDLSDDELYRMTRFPRWAVNELVATIQSYRRVTHSLWKVYESIHSSLVTFSWVHFTKFCKFGHRSVALYTPWQTSDVHCCCCCGSVSCISIGWCKRAETSADSECTASASLWSTDTSDSAHSADDDRESTAL